MITIFVEV